MSDSKHLDFSNSEAEVNPPSYIPLDFIITINSDNNEGPPPPSYIPPPPVTEIENYSDSDKTPREPISRSNSASSESTKRTIKIKPNETKENREQNTRHRLSSPQPLKLGIPEAPDEHVIFPAKEYGPPPPSYIPAPPTRKYKRYSQPRSSPRDTKDGPPPPGYVPPLPINISDNSKNVATNQIMGELNSSLSCSLSYEISKPSCAIFVSYLVNQLTTHVEDITVMTKSWLRHMEGSYLIPKSIFVENEENLSEFKKIIMSQYIYKILRDKYFSSEENNLSLPLGVIHSNFPELYNILYNYESTEDFVRYKMKELYEIRKNYKQSEETCQSHPSSIYFSGPYLLGSAIFGIESIVKEFMNLSKFLEKKQQQLVINAAREITKSLTYVEKIKSSMEKEEMYLTNLSEFSETIKVPQKIKLELVIPGRRFLQSAIFQHYIISGGKFKRGNQMLVCLFNDMMVFAQEIGKETRRLSTGPKGLVSLQLHPTPRPHYKVVEFMNLDVVTVHDKGFGSDYLLEFISPGKRIILGIEDISIKQDWMKSLNTQISERKLKGTTVEKRVSDKRQRRHSANAQGERKLIIMDDKYSTYDRIDRNKVYKF